MPIGKGIVDIMLANVLLTIECNAKQRMDDGGIYHETESLVKINARLLMKAFNNKASFIPCNRSVRIMFNTKHLFVAHNIQPRSWGTRIQVAFRMRASYSSCIV